MPIQITITAEYAAEARAEMRELLRDGVLENRAADEAVKRVEGTTPPADEAIEAAVSEPTEAEPTPEPAKRKRRTKAEIEADKAAEAPQQNISASPEDRQEPEAEEVAEAPENLQDSFFDDDNEEAPAEQDDMIDGYAITDQGLQAVMHAYVAKFDMTAAQKNAKALFGGFNKRSEVAAAGADALRTAIANFARAIKTDKEV